MSGERGTPLPAWRREGGPGEATPAAVLDRLEGNFTHAVISFLDDQGYPLSVATGFRVDADRGVLLLDSVAGEAVAPPAGREVNIILSHVRPQPGFGYDERRYVSMWGTLAPSATLSLIHI